jgi:hypothetical protein
VREWVGVEKGVLMKMAESPATQGFAIISSCKPPAHLTPYRFQRFLPKAIALVCAMMFPSAQPNLENLIMIEFGLSAVETSLNPY